MYLSGTFHNIHIVGMPCWIPKPGSRSDSPADGRGFPLSVKHTQVGIRLAQYSKPNFTLVWIISAKTWEANNNSRQSDPWLISQSVVVPL